MVALRKALEVSNAFALDEMLCAPLLMADLPTSSGANHPGEEPLPRPVTDNDVSQLQEWLQRSGLPKIGKDTVHQGVDLRAEERKFHPVRDYLDELTWDRTPRLDTWLASYLGADDSPYTKGVGRMFLLAMVARIYNPGCKCDYMLILEGEQGVGKSRACRTLAGEWFSDALPEIRQGKDASDHTRGKWRIEIAELSATSKADAEALKAFLTRDTERFRPAYGRKEIISKRQCIFIGTTNKEAYLRDETGARRFWPIKVGQIDIPSLSRDRDQLFAEAVKAYRGGERWWPDPAFEREHIQPQQDNRFEADAWEEAIKDYVVGRDRVTVTDVALGAFGLDKVKVGTHEQRRIASVLTRFGWKSGKDWQGRCYSRP